MEDNAPEKVGGEVSDPQDGMHIAAAFVIAIGPDGNVFLERDPKALSFEVERPATLIEVRRYLSEILMDLNAQAAAEYVTLRLAEINKQQ